jgi:hypothetical protein
MEQNESQGKQPRRRFISSLLAAAAGLGALLLAPRRARAQGKQQRGPGPTETGPILYRRTEEAERYYRTLYR